MRHKFTVYSLPDSVLVVIQYRKSMHDDNVIKIYRQVI